MSQVWGRLFNMYLLVLSDCEPYFGGQIAKHRSQRVFGCGCYKIGRNSVKTDLSAVFSFTQTPLNSRKDHSQPWRLDLDFYYMHHCKCTLMICDGGPRKCTLTCSLQVHWTGTVLHLMMSWCQMDAFQCWQLVHMCLCAAFQFMMPIWDWNSHDVRNELHVDAFVLLAKKWNGCFMCVLLIFVRFEGCF